MTDIAKAVELAKKWVRACEWTGNADSSSAEIVRALLAMAPVVEAAREWRAKPCECGKKWPNDEVPDDWECPNVKAEEELSAAIDALDKAGAK